MCKDVNDPENVALSEKSHEQMSTGAGCHLFEAYSSTAHSFKGTNMSVEHILSVSEWLSRWNEGRWKTYRGKIK
jgi:hypothetical protein